MKIDVFEPIERDDIVAGTHTIPSSEGSPDQGGCSVTAMYVMSIFKLQLGLCDDLMKHIRAYWWGSDQGGCSVTAYVCYEHFRIPVRLMR
jgi:hypothetical protein